jgi:hypothetical protein
MSLCFSLSYNNVTKLKNTLKFLAFSEHTRNAM